MSDQQLFELKQRVAALERKVADLSARLGQGGPQYGFADSGFGDGPQLGPAESDPELMELIQGGKEIQAIRRYRELTGEGLAEARDTVKRIMHHRYGPLDQQ